MGGRQGHSRLWGPSAEVGRWHSLAEKHTEAKDELYRAVKGVPGSGQTTICAHGSPVRRRALPNRPEALGSLLSAPQASSACLSLHKPTEMGCVCASFGSFLQVGLAPDYSAVSGLHTVPGAGQSNGKYLTKLNKHRLLTEIFILPVYCSPGVSHRPMHQSISYNFLIDF